MAAWLYNYLMMNEHSGSIGIRTLQTLSGAAHIESFRPALHEAIRELIDIGYLSTDAVDDDNIRVVRKRALLTVD